MLPMHTDLVRCWVQAQDSAGTTCTAPTHRQRFMEGWDPHTAHKAPLKPTAQVCYLLVPRPATCQAGSWLSGALEPSGVWARASSSLGMGLVFLALLSLQVKKPTQGGGFKKMHQQQKNQDPVNVSQKEEDKKIKEIGSWGEKDLTNRAIH